MTRSRLALPLIQASGANAQPSPDYPHRATGAGANDAHFMRLALQLARSRLGLTSPNPAVGCVIVRDGVIVGRAATAQGGRPHAEPQALQMAAARARGATAYVSFEPCAHFGETPPCVQGLIDAGVKRVVIGCVDPYPPVRGRSIARLKKAGVEVVTGVLGAECRRLNEGFITRVTKGRPFAILKLALSLDGRIATARGDSRWLSSPESRAIVHRWRAECDAIMVGAGTVRADNPRLTCRVKAGRDPVRVIIDGNLTSPADARVYRQKSTAPTLLITTPRNLGTALRRYRNSAVEVIAVKERAGEVSLAEVMRQLARRGWCRVLIEGGAHLAGSALRAGVVDRVAFFFAPKIIGGGLAAVEGLEVSRVAGGLKLRNLSARKVGMDWLLEGDVH